MIIFNKKLDLGNFKNKTSNNTFCNSFTSSIKLSNIFSFHFQALFQNKLHLIEMKVLNVFHIRKFEIASEYKRR